VVLLFKNPSRRVKRRRKQIAKAIGKGSEKYADSTGKVRFENEAILIVGIK
jgi:hypothetical protein